MHEVRTLGSTALNAAIDIVTARQNARRFAALAGLDRQQQTRIATAVSEVARNAFQHARHGEAQFSVVLEPGRERLEIVVRDQGPGMPDVEAALAGRLHLPPGRGAGLLSARRLVDEFALTSSPQGTVVTLAQRVPRAALRSLQRVAVAPSQAVPAAPDDPVEVVQEQNRELVESLSALDDRWKEAARLNQELEETNRGVVALYSELEHQAEQLRNASDMKSRFLSNISHEFRTPLNSILALSRLLADGVDGSLSAEQQRQVDYIRRSAQGLLELVNDLLDLAKVEAGRVEVRPTVFGVDQLFASLRGSLRPLLTNPAVELRFHAEPGVGAVRADEQKVTQILRNLIANALKFTVQGTVAVRAWRDAGEARIHIDVSDTGIGIAPADQARIFEEFAQVEGPLQRGGTGLGLPLSRRLAQVMGGDVTVASVPGQGSTFTLAVPDMDGVPQKAPASPGTHTLLIIDDEEAFRYVARHIAQDSGFDVIEAADGEAGLELLARHTVHAVVLDLQLPGTSGFQVLGRISALPAPPPVMVCTSQSLSMEQKRALAHAYAILSKSEISRESLSSLLKVMVQRKEEGS